jgi:aminopeptidase N
MKNKFTLLLLSFSLVSNLFSQEENHSCSQLKAGKITPKNGSLTISQIAESEKYDVTYYDLNLSMTNLNTNLSGTGGIYGKARVAMDSVLFELFSTFTISEIRINNVATPYSRANSAIKVPANLTTGQSFKIEIDYSGTPPNGVTNPLGGSGMTNASSPSWGNRVTWSLSEPFSAYEWWPCKQSLRDKADSVSVKITVPNACKAGSNGVLENVVNLGNGKTRYEWKHRHVIDYYLISVAVAEYVDYTIYANPVGAPNPVKIQNYIYNNPQTLIYFQDDIDETVNFLEYFSELFGLYPYHTEKYGHSMAPLGGGMEHQTMTTQGSFNKTLTAHELAHQWWGNQVTCASWSDIWVNEGFASYAEYLMLEEMYPGQENGDMLDRHQDIMSLPGGSIWVTDSLSDGAIFSGRLTYNKGAAFVHTLRFMLNNDAQFFQALRDYQIAFKDSVAVGIDIKNTLETASGLDLNAAFEEWYFGQGYPTYSAIWNAVGNDLHIKINHTSSRSNVTPTFTNPLEVRFSRTGQSDTLVRFSIYGNQSNFIVPEIGIVSNVTGIDPNNWIINKTGSIQKNPNLNMLSTENIESDIAFEVFPNPATDAITISNKTADKCHVKLLDSKGKVLKVIDFSEKVKIDLTGYSAGSYILKIENSTVERTHLIIKK